MIRPTFIGEWRHVAGPLLLTFLVVGAALGFALA